MKNILVGITGGIAAYKSLTIISQLLAKGYAVRVVMTPHATKIIPKATVEAIAGSYVFVDEWETESAGRIEHIALAQWADAFLIAPATYNTVGNIANGVANTMLTCIVAACKQPIFLALAMNDAMYSNPILQRNISYLSSLGYHIIEAGEGRLACGVYGKGRLQESEAIIAYIESILDQSMIPALQGRKIMITAGRTEEYIDPIRYISNRSSGRMGFALAKVAMCSGAHVTLVMGKHSVPSPYVTESVVACSADEMYTATMERIAMCDIFIACAAVADYKIKEYSTQKIKKNEPYLSMVLAKNKDILADVAKMKVCKYVVGFSLETENMLENAHHKLQYKQLDMIIANSSENIEEEKATLYLCFKDGKTITLEKDSKEKQAFHIMQHIAEEIGI